MFGHLGIAWTVKPDGTRVFEPFTRTERDSLMFRAGVTVASIAESEQDVTPIAGEIGDRRGPKRADEVDAKRPAVRTNKAGG